MPGLKLLCFVTAFSVVATVPIVLKGSSPSGETVIAISSSDPNVERYISFNFPNKSEATEDLDINPGNPFQKTFTTADISFNFPNKSEATEDLDINPGNPFQKTFTTAVAGTNTSTGRGFGSFNPFFLPFFNFPNFEGFGLNFGPWTRGVESHPMENGEVQTVTAINDNGHVYGKVKTVTLDNTYKKTQ